MHRASPHHVRPKTIAAGHNRRFTSAMQFAGEEEEVEQWSDPVNRVAAVILAAGREAEIQTYKVRYIDIAETRVSGGGCKIGSNTDELKYAC